MTKLEAFLCNVVMSSVALWIATVITLLSLPVQARPLQENTRKQLEEYVEEIHKGFSRWPQYVKSFLAGRQI
jgi:hypothetical protein